MGIIKGCRKNMIKREWAPLHGASRISLMMLIGLFIVLVGLVIVLVGLVIVLVGLFIVLIGLVIVLVGLFIALVGLFIASRISLMMVLH
jgi:hypothetical protein